MSARRSAHELRALLIDAGRRVLYADGLRATASHVPMTAATAELERTHGIKVTMGSIFGRGRLWTDVREFQLDLLRSVIEDSEGGGPNDSSLALIHDHLDDLADRPYEERVETLVDLCRFAGEVNGYLRPDAAKGRTWDLWVGIWATAMTADDGGDHLRPALLDEVRRTNDSFVAVYRLMNAKLGLRVRAPYSLEHLAVLAAAVTDGVALRTALDPALTAGRTEPATGQPWTLLGVGLKAIALELLEDDR